MFPPGALPAAHFDPKKLPAISQRQDTSTIDWGHSWLALITPASIFNRAGTLMLDNNLAILATDKFLLSTRRSPVTASTFFVSLTCQMG